MIFATLDFIVILLFLLITLFLVYKYSKRNQTVSEYFASSGKLNWFVAGTAMAATTFAADTPLAVTELVAKHGISGNWVWWYGSIGSILTVYLFAPLWKKSGVLTDLELIHIRYSGSAVKWLRIFKSVYMGFVMNVIILAWVNLAMVKISNTIFPQYPAQWTVSILFLIAFFYTIASGLTGISKIDVFQFFLAMFGCIILAWFAVQHPVIGGIDGLKSKLDPSYFYFIPDFKNTSAELSLDSFIIMISVTWWASWYPGAEPGGGGYIAQRIFAAEDRKAAVYSTLLFVILHYFLRPWPWILAGLASLVLFPSLPEAEKSRGFIMLLQYTPDGVKGLMLVSFIAAYLSTIATHLNWGASYVINDMVKPYLLPDKKDSEYLNISKVLQLLLMFVSLYICFNILETISGAWIFLIHASSGIGFVLIMRWFWWRINVWSEIAALFIPPLFYSLARYYLQLGFSQTFLLTVGASVSLIILISYLSPQTNHAHLLNFYQKIKPPGIFWKKWALKHGVGVLLPDINLWHVLLLVLSGIVLLFSALFLSGSLILGFYNYLYIYIILLILAVLLTQRYLPKLLK